MREPLGYAAAGLGALSSAASALGTLWIFAIMALINGDVIGRQLFDTPINGVPEMVSQSIVGIVFLQLAEALRRGRMIRSDVLLKRLLTTWPGLGRALLTFHSLVGAAVMGLICYFSVPRLVYAWTENEYVGSYGNFMMPIWPIVAIVVLSSALSTLYFLGFALTPRRSAEAELAEPSHG